MVWMFGMYRQDNSDQEFKFLHVFSKIESCEKWRKVRHALAKAKDAYNLDTPAPTVEEGRPDGTRRARAASDAAPAVELLQSSIKQCIAHAKNRAAKREDKSDARWSVFMMKKDKVELVDVWGAKPGGEVGSVASADKITDVTAP
ncbi:putative methionyl-tRNA synthetase [Hordeum vulgare]|nr:putative methionyl-tRNA synthetase [Hordeum vulgare]